MLDPWVYCEPCRTVHAEFMTRCTQEHAWQDIGYHESRQDAINHIKLKIPELKLHKNDAS